MVGSVGWIVRAVDSYAVELRAVGCGWFGLRPRARYGYGLLRFATVYGYARESFTDGYSMPDMRSRYNDSSVSRCAGWLRRQMDIRMTVYGHGSDGTFGRYDDGAPAMDGYDQFRMDCTDGYARYRYQMLQYQINK